MSVTFTKLFSSLTESTVWCESHEVRIVWITMLAMADKRGRVWGSVPGLANRARVPVEETREALRRFLGPDADSRTAEHEGRRIEPMDGGWRLLNYEKYREVRDEEDRREYQRVKKQESRQRMSTMSTQVNTSSHNAEAEAEAEEQKQEHEPSSLSLVSEAEPKQVVKKPGRFEDGDVESIWKLWPNTGGKRTGLVSIRQALKQRSMDGVVDPVVDLTTRVRTWLAWHARETAAGRFVAAIGFAQGWFGDAQRRYLDPAAEPPPETRLLLSDGTIITAAESEAQGWTVMRGDG